MFVLLVGLIEVMGTFRRSIEISLSLFAILNVDCFDLGVTSFPVGCLVLKQEFYLIFLVLLSYHLDS